MASVVLIWHGMFLFLLGLLTGFVEQQFNNPRMGLAAHLEGVMNGTFLIALGAVWTEVRLSPRLKAGAYWSALYGTYANWTATTLAAIFGTASLSPDYWGRPQRSAVAGAGRDDRLQYGRDSDSCLCPPRPMGLAARRCVMIVGMFPEHLWTGGVPERSALNSWKRSWRR
jgi:hydroxylaminobenzene mutase